MKRFKNQLSKPWAQYTIALSIAIVLFLFLTNLPVIYNSVKAVLDVFSPVIIGLIIAYLLNPLVNTLEKKPLRKIKKQSVRHTVAVFIVVTVIVILISLLIASLIPSLFASISNLIRNKDEYISKVVAFSQRFNNNIIHIDQQNLTDKINSTIDSVIDKAYQNMSAILSKVKDVGSVVSNFAFGFIFGVCFLLGKDTIGKVVKNIRRAYMKEERYEKHNTFWMSCHEIFVQYFSCTIIDALIIGVSNAIFMTIFKIPYVTLISALVGFTNIIPTVGPAIGVVLGAFILLLAKPIYALYFVIFTVILQTLDAMVIKPKLFSESLGLPAIWSIVAITLGGKIGGMIGIILSIPLTAILVIFYKKTILPWTEKRQAKLNGEEKPAEDEKETVTEETDGEKQQ